MTNNELVDLIKQGLWNGWFNHKPARNILIKEQKEKSNTIEFINVDTNERFLLTVRKIT